MFNYVVTANKPTAVTHSVVGNFTSPIDINLIICKSTRIEIHVATPAGLQPLLDVGIYGRVAALELYRPHGETQDWLLVLTERYKFFVLAYDSKSGEIITKANGDVGSRIGRPADIGQIAMVDPECRVIGMHLYDGLFKVIPIDPKGMLKEAFDIRLEETRVLDIKFLHGLAKPTVAVLYQDPKEARHVKTYEISLKDKDFTDGPKSLSNLEAGASFIIPLPAPLGGMLIVGEQSITYQAIANNTIKSIALKTTTIMKAYGKIDADGSRYLMGDFLGNLYVVILDHDRNLLTDLKIEKLGEISIPSTISYIDSSAVFIGSAFGDSQLIKLNSSKDEADSFIQVQEAFANMGPITDFVVVDLDRQGQGQVVACSGAFKHGSLRIIRSGIGINEQASIDLPGIKGIWSLRSPSDKKYDKYIILSFVGETRVLAMTGEELEETEIAGFQLDEQTIHCANVVDDLLLQITSKSINLVDGNTLQSVHKWTPPPSVNINVASCTKTQIILGTGGGSLVYIEIQDKQLKEISHKKLEHEISCVNISPLGDKERADICAVGMWTDISIRLFTIPSLTMIASEPLGGEIIPRSVLLVSLEGINYLLCALGDGHLFTFVLGDFENLLREKRKVSLSTQPIILNTFRTNGIVNVFAASDRPTVIYSNNKKLLYSNVNLKEANYMCPFNSESFPESLAIGTEESLKIGTIDSIQKLHIRTVPLGGEMPRRIAHQESTNSFCVLTLKTSADPDSPESETGFVKFFDATTFEVLGSMRLGNYESPCSATSLSLGDDPTPYYVVGTAFAFPAESEPSKGRILLFSVSEGKHKLISELEVKGAVYALCPFNGKILAGVNSKVHLYNWVEAEDGGRKLKLECSHSGHLLALYLATRGDFIIVGDLMKSISLLAYRTTENVIEEIARDYDAKWMTAVEVLDDDTFIGAENSYNLFTVKKNSDAATDDDRSRLEVSGLFHLGEFVNRFRPGSLVMRLPDTEAASMKTLLYGSVNGTIGVIASISTEQFQFFSKVQQNLEKVIKGVGGLSHSDWRGFSNDRKTIESRNFIDGDLIESILDLKPEKVAEVAKGLEVTADELIKRVESLQQALH